MKKYYFESLDSEICFNKNEFEKGQEVFEAVPEKIKGLFWCRKDCECYEIGYEDWSCGKDCKDYTPRNGIKGCCKFYSNIFYTHGKKAIII